MPLKTVHKPACQ